MWKEDVLAQCETLAQCFLGVLMKTTRNLKSKYPVFRSWLKLPNMAWRSAKKKLLPSCLPSQWYTPILSCVCLLSVNVYCVIWEFSSKYSKLWYTYMNWSRDSSVNIVTSTDCTARVRFPTRQDSTVLHKVWGTPSSVYNGYRVLSSQVKARGARSWPLNSV